MIVATPLDLPRIEPDSWPVFWSMWQQHADWLQKVGQIHVKPETPIGSNNIWMGLDIIKNLKGRPFSWEAPFFDIKEVLPTMYRSIVSAVPDIIRARLVQSTINIKSHTDDNYDKWNLRALLHNTSSMPQWYFTKPQQPQGQRYYLNMPQETNWFAYNDKRSWHGTDYNPDHKKILLQIFSSSGTDSLVTHSAEKYKSFVIDF